MNVNAIDAARGLGLFWKGSIVNPGAACRVCCLCAKDCGEHMLGSWQTNRQRHRRHLKNLVKPAWFIDFEASGRPIEKLWAGPLDAPPGCADVQKRHFERTLLI